MQVIKSKGSSVEIDLIKFLTTFLLIFFLTLTMKSYAESDLNLVCTGKEQITTQLTTQDNKNIAELNALYSIKVNLQQKTILIPALDLSFCDEESGDCNCTLDNCKCMFTKDEFFCFSNKINSNVPRFDAERQRIVIDRSTGVTNMQIDQYSQSKGKDIFRKIDLICKKQQENQF